MSLFSDPEQNIEAAGIQPGSIIADFGAGGGQYVCAAAYVLASTGRVYGIDVKKEALVAVAELAQGKNLSNVDVIYGDIQKPSGSGLAANCVDLVIMSNILFQLQDKRSALTEAKRVLKPGGKVLGVHWKTESQSDTVQLFEHNGFAKEKEFPAGSHHYGMIFKKL